MTIRNMQSDLLPACVDSATSMSSKFSRPQVCLSMGVTLITFDLMMVLRDTYNSRPDSIEWPSIESRVRRL